MRASLLVLATAIIVGVGVSSAIAQVQCTPCCPEVDCAAVEEVRTAGAGVAKRIYDMTGEAWSHSGMISCHSLVRELKDADVIFIGEYHDDPNTHLMELDLLQQLCDVRDGLVVLSMEMFERDVQEALDDYMADAISEEEFLELTRPWPNYETDYRPMIEYCKGMELPVIAANIPRSLASRIAKDGFDAAWDGYSDEERQWIAAEATHPKDAYFGLFNMVMGGNGHDMGLSDEQVASFYAAQCIKDDTMAEGIAKQRTLVPEMLVVHVNGSFHSDYHLGTAMRLAILCPEDKVMTVAVRPAEGFGNLDPHEENMPAEASAFDATGATVDMSVADYVMYVPAPEEEEEAEEEMAADEAAEGEMVMETADEMPSEMMPSEMMPDEMQADETETADGETQATPKP